MAWKPWRFPRKASRVLETGSSDRMANMVTFANAALELLEECVGGTG